MDWDAWARRAEQCLAATGEGSWKDLFAEGARFSDPQTTKPTTDLGKISRDTLAMFPDWRQEITSIRGGEDWAVFEWVGRATYSPHNEGPGAGAEIEMHGATIVELDDHGLVTRWRDYLDRKEPEEQILKALR